MEARIHFVGNTMIDTLLANMDRLRISDFTARGLQQAKDELDVLKLPDSERRAYERHQDDLHQQASMFQSSYGVGLLQVRKLGRKLGREEGQDEGRRTERERIARSLLDVIADDTVIAEKLA
ncbi:hypothetical protein Thiowin_04580 [Thiorhodovibrio winogradskyi]|uniref:Uncharacterized protein n=1 Tax=Thiorhodovibrio winogradskyi TaxID=77007 RepID=A0ABZ0SGM2_9GAMM|nr:hypothetical protein [Thiorhodovibrio winogradskyi]